MVRTVTKVIAVRLKGDGSYSTSAVGESHYQDALRLLAGGHSEESARIEKLAGLVPEPTNRFDEHAVMVQIETNKVGYLSRDDALLYHQSMAEMERPFGVAVVDAIIVGGFRLRDGSYAHFGVRLDFELPFSSDD